MKQFWKNRNGISMIELVIALALVSILLVFVFQLLIDIRYEDTLTKDNAANFITQSLVVKAVQDDIISRDDSAVQNSKSLEKVQRFSDASKRCYTFTFRDSGYTSNLCFYNDNFITYNREKYNLAGSAKIVFEDIKIDKSDPVKNKNGINYFIIKVPIRDNANKVFDIEISYAYSPEKNAGVDVISLD